MQTVEKTIGSSSEPVKSDTDSPIMVMPAKLKIKFPPAEKTKKLKIKMPVAAASTDWMPARKPAMSGLLVMGMAAVLIAAVIAMSYLRFAKGVDIFKPIRNRLATAAYVLFKTDDHVVVKREDLNYLISNSKTLPASIPMQDVEDN
jgi:hypothetical protein